MSSIVPVVLAGGTGSRLWPLSRSRYPKQCIDLEGKGQSLLQATLSRCAALGGQAPIIVCNEEHRFLIAEQARQVAVAPRSILLEPVGRNTAPAIAAAAWQLAQSDPEALMLVLPSDHAIADAQVFAERVALGAEPAAAGALVTFGIKPDQPETGYGYIQAEGDGDLARVVQFVEKPDLARAQAYLADGRYLWNSGMFLFRVDVLLAELARLEPELHRLTQASLVNATRDLDFTRLDADSFGQVKAISIDYAVMERTQQARVVRFPAIWDDVGSWSSLWRIGQPDADNNLLRGDALALDCHNTLVNASSRLVTAVGVDDLIIVETDDAVMVTRKDAAQDVKKLVDALVASGRSEVDWHREVHRPWGCYRGMVLAERYQVKRITVNPGQRLSTQLHHHRAEHWVVVRGTARVRNGDQELLISENQSTYIPIGTIHSLENPGKIPLELIEIQTGGYLGEDDIVRLDDIYGRA